MDLVSQNLLLTSGGKKDSTYVDDVFSTFLYTGTGSAQTINNGIDLAGEGGMVWFKSRTTGGSSFNNNSVVDTARVDSSGRGKSIYPNLTEAEYSPENTSNITTSFNSNGFTTGTNANNATNTQTLASWTFRKQKGFFDIVTYTGNATDRAISHSLGCIPGFIIIKRTNAAEDWTCYHRNLGGLSQSGQYSVTEEFIDLNKTSAVQDDAQHDIWNDTAPTATHFTVGTHARVNGNNDTYVCYLFAGGESTAATARSVEFDGNDELEAPSSTDFDFGSGDFTMECWVKHDTSSGNQVYLNRSYYSASSNSSWLLFGNANGNVDFYATYSTGWSFQMSAPATINDKSWHHIAVVRDGTNIKIYVDGTLSKTQSIGSNAIPNSTRIVEIGSQWNSAYFTGKISNVRIVKGTAVYTSSFKPSYQPLANITNTILLCCQSSTVTTATVTPGALTTVGDPTASSDSPFDDPEGFKFGEEGDQNLIKCGSYITDASEDATINLGWEPQWILVKRIDSASGGPDWLIYDSFRGLMNAEDIRANQGGSKSLSPNLTSTESNNSRIGATSTGFYADQYGANRSYMYMAIRRPDALVAKPPEAGTDVFAMDTGNGSSTIPAFDSGFPVDFQLNTKPGSTWDKYAGSRLTQGKYLATNSHSGESTSSEFVYDSNVGWCKGSANNSSYQSWMWKRHAGFDVVTYAGNSTAGRQIPHSLNKVPEMIWLRSRTTTGRDWVVYHKSLNGGVNPWLYKMRLDHQDGERSNSSFFGTAPTARYFGVGTSADTNGSGENIIAFLFASVDGISKVGSYTGNASSSGPTITLGFAPRFIIIKCASVDGTNWFVYDTLRGLTAGNDKRLYLNTNGGQDTADDIDPSATGFQVVSTWDQLNDNNATYIYYAHA